MSRTKPTVLAKTKPNALIGCLGIVLAGRLGLYVDFDGWFSFGVRPSGGSAAGGSAAGGSCLDPAPIGRMAA